MPYEILLILVTLAVAIVGTVWRDPPKVWKIALVGLALLTSILSIVKAFSDEDDKNFTQKALLTILVPSSPSYERIAKEVTDVASESRHLDGDYNCPHSPEGMTCFIYNSDKSQQGTVVFNNVEVAEMYKNDISQKNNSKLVQKIWENSYAPENRGEEFLDKVGVLGYGVFFDMYNRFPLDYNYEREKFGIEVKFTDANGKDQRVRFTPAELTSIPASKEPELFEALGQRFRAKYETVARTTPILVSPKPEEEGTEAKKPSK